MSPRMVINGEGHVGIGTFNPAVALAVNGNQYIAWGSLGFNRNPFDGSLPPDGNAAGGRFQISNFPDRLQLETYNSSGTSTGVMSLLASNGNVGIGTVSPQAMLHVNGPVIVGCRGGFWTAADGRICVDSTLRGPNNAWDAIGVCKGIAPGCRVCTHTDLQQACGSGIANPYGAGAGWYGDHGGGDNTYAIWNRDYCDNDNDGPIIGANDASLNYRCCY